MTKQPVTTAPSYRKAKRLKLLLSVVQSISPKIAYRKAINIFYTPIKFSTPERELHYKNSSIISRELVNDKRITVYHNGQGERKVLLVHGWSGRASQFYKMAPAIIKTGFKVFSFTAPAHGTSEDKQTHMLEFTDCVEYLDKKYGPFEAIISHSIGGAATLNAVQRGISPIKIVLLGAPAYMKDVVLDFCNKLGLNRRVADLIIEHLKNRYDRDYEKFSVTRISESLNIPGLIIHDHDDTDVSIEHARTNQEAWKNSQLIETKGLGHRLILSDEQVITRIIEFIQ